jgi:RNA exonuclease 4
MQEDGNIPFDRKNKATSPPGWNPSNEDLTGIVALDCEMVGVGLDGASDSLARVVIVNYYGGVLLDRSVRQEEHVVDTRTKISGIRRKDLKRGDDFKKVQEDVYKILKDKIVVGHGLASDFKVLMLDHPKLYTRDTARYRPLQRVPGKPHSLKELGSEVLGISIHEGKHHPVEDAQTALLVYRHVQKNWEASIKAAVKTPSSINPITKLVEKTNREALKVASTPGSPASSTKQKVTKQPSSDVDSWASSESVSEDDSSDASQSNGSDDNSSSGESDSEDSE